MKNFLKIKRIVFLLFIITLTVLNTKLSFTDNLTVNLNPSIIASANPEDNNSPNWGIETNRVSGYCFDCVEFGGVRVEKKCQCDMVYIFCVWGGGTQTCPGDDPYHVMYNCVETGNNCSWF